MSRGSGQFTAFAFFSCQSSHPFFFLQKFVNLVSVFPLFFFQNLFNLDSLQIDAYPWLTWVGIWLYPILIYSYERLTISEIRNVYFFSSYNWFNEVYAWGSFLKPTIFLLTTLFKMLLWSLLHSILNGNWSIETLMMILIRMEWKIDTQQFFTWFLVLFVKTDV